MSGEDGKTFNMSGAVSALERLAETRDESRRSVRERLAEPALYEAIQKAKTAGKTNAEIAAALTAEGMRLTAGTLARYLRRIKAENRSRIEEAEAAASRQAVPARQGDRPGAQPAAGSEKQPRDSGNGSSIGKHLTRRPAMGGAFGIDEL